MAKLSVNVNKIATLRNSRGKNSPNLIKTTLAIVAYGAQGITVHPRPDERHIRQVDVYELAKNINVEFNIEGYPDENYLKLIEEIKPVQCTLVPDPPHVLTSNAGWELEKNSDFLYEVVAKSRDWGIRTSLFVDPYRLSINELESLTKIAPDRVELYTESYADHYGTENEAKTIAVYQNAARAILQRGIGLNAGHDLSLVNLRDFIKAIPIIEEVSIGHALICDALFLGLEETVAQYLACLNGK